VQADLEGGDARVGRRGAGGDGRGDKDQGQSEERPGTHGLTVFAVSAGIPWQERAEEEVGGRVENRPPTETETGEAASFPGKRAAAPFRPPKSLLSADIGQIAYWL
jgi:hypothetical protein